MVKLSLLLGGVTLVWGKANGMIGDSNFEAQRKEVSRVVQDSYIVSAKVDDAAACDILRNNIRQIQGKMIGLNANTTLKSARIKSNCFVRFSGPSAILPRIRLMQGVSDVSPEQFVYAAQGPMSWGLDRIDQYSLPLNNLPFRSTHTGKGVTVYILDTGVRKSHREFSNRVKTGASFVNGETADFDGNGHGTHCAGIATGTKYGVAKEATVIGVKVLSSSGGGTNYGVIEGVEWATNHAKSAGTVGVISMSLGGGKNAGINAAVEAAADEGMLVIVAAGNDNHNACYYSPASAGGKVVTVGSTTKNDGRSWFSNHGSCVDIFAPGSDIISSWKDSDTSTNTISGTSMATPFVAGVAATLLEKHNFDADAARAELLTITASSKLSDVGTGSPNKLLQTSR